MSLPCDHLIEEIVQYQCCPKKVLRCVKTDEPRCPFCPKLGAAAEPVKKDSVKWFAPKPELEVPAPLEKTSMPGPELEKAVMIPDPKPTMLERFRPKKKPAPAEQEPASEPDDEPDSNVE